WISLARHAVLAQTQRFEEGAEAEILLLRDRIVLVIVTVSAIQRQAKEGLAGVLDNVAHPLIGIERIPVAHQVTRRIAPALVGRDLVAGQHRGEHAIVAAIGIERADDPVAPAINLRGAVPDIRNRAPAIPVAVTPDVHPVPRPALAMLRAGQ